MAAPIEVLPAIAEAVAGKAPILIDGSFRRGSDIMKALALGARAVMLGRPALWALAAYGSAGVQTMLEMLQTELARDMAMCGKPNLKSLDPSAGEDPRPRSFEVARRAGLSSSLPPTPLRTAGH